MMSGIHQGPLSPDMLDKMNRYWCAANYLCLGQIYLFDKPLVTGAAQGRTDQSCSRSCSYWRN